MRDRTADLLRARQALSQLSYRPTIFLYILIYVIICVDTGMQTSSFV